MRYTAKTLTKARYFTNAKTNFNCKRGLVSKWIAVNGKLVCQWTFED